MVRRAGRPHPFDVIEPARTALVVIDMQNYFMKPGFMGEVPHARSIVPNVNRMAAALRERGGRRIFVEGGGVTVSAFLEANLLDRLHIVPADLLDQHSLTSVIRDARPQEVYNLAAQSFVPNHASRMAVRARAFARRSGVAAKRGSVRRSSRPFPRT